MSPIWHVPLDVLGNWMNKWTTLSVTQKSREDWNGLNNFSELVSPWAKDKNNWNKEYITPWWTTQVYSHSFLLPGMIYGVLEVKVRLRWVRCIFWFFSYCLLKNIFWFCNFVSESPRWLTMLARSPGTPSLNAMIIYPEILGHSYSRFDLPKVLE